MIFSDSLQARSLVDSDCSNFGELDSLDQEEVQVSYVDPLQSKSKVMPTIEESMLSGEHLLSQELIQPEVLSSDQALNVAGGGHRYQVRTLILLALQQTIQAFILQGQPFLFMQPDFKCYSDPSTKKGPYKCDDVQACKQNPSPPLWQDDPAQTLVVFFHLYCDRKYFISLTQSIYFAVSNFAILLFSFLADKFGRKRIVVLCYVIGSVPILVGGWSPSWVWFMVLFCISGVGINPYAILVFVLMQEQSNDSFRQKTTIYLLMTWGVGQIVFIPIAYFFPQWDILVVYFIGLPMVVQVLSYLCIYESVKWLVVVNRYQEARRVLTILAQVNRQSSDTQLYLKEGFMFEEEAQQAKLKEANELVSSSKKQKEDTRKYGITDLFRYKSTRFTTIALCIIYFGIYMQYFGSIFALQALGGDKYVNATILNCTELGAYILAVPVVGKLKRKLSFPGVFFIMTLCSLVFLFFGQNATVNLVMAVFSKICISISFSISYVYAPELFPTPIRGIGIGFCTFFGKFGAAVAPQLILMSQWPSIDINPMASFGIFLLVAFILALFLPETKGCALQDQIPELVEQ